MRPNRVLAVDWSGAKVGAQKKIWLCEVAAGRVDRLECGRGREEIERELISEARLDPGLVVGIDFAFSMPQPFVAKRGHREVDALWAEVERDGESWLADCPFPFWGKPGKKKTRFQERVFFRRTDTETGEATGTRPLSVFQIGGVGAVGVGSLRGMPMLRRLRREGFAVWPFDRAVAPLLVEIWPRVFMGRVTKSDPTARAAFLAERYPDLEPAHRAQAEASDDAFDALVSALAMDHHLDELARLPPAADGETAIEGRIWRPSF